MYLNAQKLNRRVTIQKRSGIKDDFGQVVDIWVDVCQLWAHVKTVTGSGFLTQEFESGGTEVSRPTASFRVRKRNGITAGMRLVYQSVPYDIRVVLPDLQDNRYMDLGCATGANQG